MRGAELIKANFIKAMDKTYFSIRNLKDIIKLEEPVASPTIPSYPPSKSKITKDPDATSATPHPHPTGARPKTSRPVQTRPNHRQNSLLGK